MIRNVQNTGGENFQLRSLTGLRVAMERSGAPAGGASKAPPPAAGQIEETAWKLLFEQVGLDMNNMQLYYLQTKNIALGNEAAQQQWRLKKRKDSKEAAATLLERRTSIIVAENADQVMRKFHIMKNMIAQRENVARGEVRCRMLCGGGVSPLGVSSSGCGLVVLPVAMGAGAPDSAGRSDLCVAWRVEGHAAGYPSHPV